MSSDERTLTELVAKARQKVNEFEQSGQDTDPIDDALDALATELQAAQQEAKELREGMHAYTEHASRWKRERDEARAIINRAHHESIAGSGRSSVVLAVVRDILAEGVAE